MFSKAIVRKPGKSFINCITSSNLGVPDYYKAVEQHATYVTALKKCGLEVIELPADENFPDSTFVEDPALLTSHCAIITNPGAPSRRGEIIGIKKALKDFYPDISEIISPGHVEAGDIMMVGDHYYIGLSARTNLSGAEQIIEILNKHGMSGSCITLEKVLHLKTGVSYLENNTLAACGEFLNKAEFASFSKIEIPEKESYATNCVWINGNVLVARGYPLTKQKIEKAGYPVLEVDVSEFRKADGGLSCLSLRF
jgi:dimethylargininase